MSLFGSIKATGRFGVVVDIGSGSVLTAIVHSPPKKKSPVIVWSHREHSPLKNIDSLEKSSKAVMAALVTSLMKLDAEGRKKLYEYKNDAKLTEMQCSISAPWSYTVTKTINYQQKKAFTVTNGLIKDLTETIQEKIESELKENEVLHNLGLQVVTRSTLGMTSNGYRVRRPEGQKANELAVSHTSVVAQKYLVEAIEEMREKLFTSARCKNLSFILMLFFMTRKLLAQTYDVCLIDVTYEATEIGIVRDGMLKYSTHVSFGTFSLAREIASITNIPLHEAFGYLHTEKPYSFMDILSKKQSEEVDAVFEAYIKKITELFAETGDALSIPKNISLHTDMNSETLFTDLIEKAAKRAIKTNPAITVISKEILEQVFSDGQSSNRAKEKTDTALLLSAQFFHNEHTGAAQCTSSKELYCTMYI